MLPLNKLGIQLELIDEENAWLTIPGANQDYVIVTNNLMQIEVVRDTEHTYDVSLTPNPEIDRLWTRPKKTKLLIKVTARTLVALADSILKRLVKPHHAALTRAREVYVRDELTARLANEGLRPFIDRHHVKEEDILYAGVGSRVAGYFVESPDAAIHVTSIVSDKGETHTLEGSVRISHLTLAELDAVIQIIKLIGEERWTKKTQSGMTLSVPEESSSPVTESPVETEPIVAAFVLVDDSPSLTSSVTS